MIAWCLVVIVHTPICSFRQDVLVPLRVKEEDLQGRELQRREQKLKERELELQEKEKDLKGWEEEQRGKAEVGQKYVNTIGTRIVE